MNMRTFLSRLLRIQLPIWLVMPMLGLTLAIGLGGGYNGADSVFHVCGAGIAE